MGSSEVDVNEFYVWLNLANCDYDRVTQEYSTSYQRTLILSPRKRERAPSLPKSVPTQTQLLFLSGTGERWHCAVKEVIMPTSRYFRDRQRLDMVLISSRIAVDMGGVAPVLAIVPVVTTPSAVVRGHQSSQPPFYPLATRNLGSISVKLRDSSGGPLRFLPTAPPLLILFHFRVLLL